jgi:hypothetical protein
VRRFDLYRKPEIMLLHHREEMQTLQ